MGTPLPYNNRSQPLQNKWWKLRTRTVKYSGNPRKVLYHVTGTRRGSLGTLFVLADWQVRVFWSSGLVDRPSDLLYIRTIFLSEWMDRISRYIPFYSQAWMACHMKNCALAASPKELFPYGIPRQEPPGPWKFQTTELPRASPIPK